MVGFNVCMCVCAQCTCVFTCICVYILWHVSLWQQGSMFRWWGVEDVCVYVCVCLLVSQGMCNVFFNKLGRACNLSCLLSW